LNGKVEIDHVADPGDEADDGGPAEAKTKEGEEGHVEVVGAAFGFGEDGSIVVGDVGGDLLLDFARLAVSVLDVSEVGLWDELLVMGRGGWVLVRSEEEYVSGLEVKGTHVVVTTDGFVLVLFQLRAQKLLGCVVGDDLRHTGRDVCVKDRRWIASGLPLYDEAWDIYGTRRTGWMVWQRSWTTFCYRRQAGTKQDTNKPETDARHSGSLPKCHVDLTYSLLTTLTNSVRDTPRVRQRLTKTTRSLTLSKKLKISTSTRIKDRVLATEHQHQRDKNIPRFWQPKRESKPIVLYDLVQQLAVFLSACWMQ
jgi:hypothetical protein